jgi:hypothetical protein
MPRKKQKPHRALRRDVTVEQVAALTHLARWAGPSLRHVHPQKGMGDEIQPLAFAISESGEMLLRLDRVPAVDGVPYTTVLRDAFPEFPLCLDLVIKGWTPESMVVFIPAPVKVEKFPELLE